MKKKKDWKPESFPKPRTFPSGWDGWSLMATNGHFQESENPMEGAKKPGKEDWNPEKFPKPRTFPKNWSVDD
jgi:hypothetical protein